MPAPAQLSQKQIEQVCKMIIGWTDKLTWQALRKQLEAKHGITLTRQALASYYAIGQAYQTRKNELKYGPNNIPARPAVTREEITLAEALAEIERLKRENARLERIKDKQLMVLRNAMANLKKKFGDRIDLQELFRPMTQRKSQ
ncbi:hypothetical protein VV869_14850 [Photobacterium sp. MCCC 1A19761]|uniref:hypothetical protein n=1 Tax=Photobacterium sp. MCCC 1A19761 TaxID=3115000 RepID=UPI00307DE0F8